MVVRVKDWWLAHGPWPFWALCTGWWSPWCWIDEMCHVWFPITFGFFSENVSHWPQPERWVCRKHSEATDRYWSKRLPEEGQ